MWKELERWDAMDRQLRIDGARSAIGGILFVLGCILLASIIMGCQPGEKPSAAQLIANAELVVITAAETMADAADAGIVSRESDQYQDAKAAIIDAREMIRFAWRAHLQGNAGEAEAWRRGALDLYVQIRPLLEQWAKEDKQ